MTQKNQHFLYESKIKQLETHLSGISKRRNLACIELFLKAYCIAIYSPGKNRLNFATQIDP